MSTPKAPDPVATANAQAGMNRDTALQQQLVNQTNQVTPDGNLTYSQSGTNSYVDSNGKTVTVPQFTATTTLSPDQEAISAQSNAAKLNLSKLANQQSAALSDQLSKPFSYTNSDAEDYSYNLGKERLDPKFATDQDNLRTQLISSGIRPGTAAYAQQMSTFGQTQNDAYNQLALNSQQQGFNQALTTYNEPVNSISALMSGSQVQNPTFTSTPTANVAGEDYQGLVQSNYQQQVASSNAAMGGLFGLLGTGVTAGIKYSDRRLKSDVRRVGTLDNGLPIYSYRLNGSPVTEIGVMADEVEAVCPAAVFEQPDGYKMVDYLMATEAA